MDLFLQTLLSSWWLLWPLPPMIGWNGRRWLGDPDDDEDEEDDGPDLGEPVAVR